MLFMDASVQLIHRHSRVEPCAARPVRTAADVSVFARRWCGAATGSRLTHPRDLALVIVATDTPEPSYMSGVSRPTTKRGRIRRRHAARRARMRHP